MSIQGKTLIVTGASQGIGLAVTRQAVADGARVVGAARTIAPSWRAVEPCQWQWT